VFKGLSNFHVFLVERRKW